MIQSAILVGMTYAVDPFVWTDPPYNIMCLLKLDIQPFWGVY
jgi:hypothetical protein